MTNLLHRKFFGGSESTDLWQSARIAALFFSTAIFICCACPARITASEMDEVTGLLNQLKSGNADRRAEAAYALGETRDRRAIDPLLGILRDPSEDGQVRMGAACSLGALGDASAVEPLIETMREDMKMRTGILAACIGALGELKDPRAVPILLKALGNRADDWIYREMAARALGEIGDARAVGPLLSAAYMADTRHDAIEALAKIGDPEAVDILIEALDEGEEADTAEAAKAGLLRIGPQAVPALVKKMTPFSKEYPENHKRATVAEILGALCDNRAEKALRNAAEDPSPLVRKSAEQALEKIKNCKERPSLVK